MASKSKRAPDRLEVDLRPLKNQHRGEYWTVLVPNPRDQFKPEILAQFHTTEALETWIKQNHPRAVVKWLTLPGPSANGAD